MNIEAFFLCDAATIQGDKLNVLGAFDHISLKGYPPKEIEFSVAARIRFDKGEKGSHHIKVSISKDGKFVTEKGWGWGTMKVKTNDEVESATIAGALRGFWVKQFGNYKVDLLIDNKIVATLPLIIDKNCADLRTKF